MALGSIGKRARRIAAAASVGLASMFSLSDNANADVHTNSPSNAAQDTQVTENASKIWEVEVLYKGRNEKVGFSGDTIVQYNGAKVPPSPEAMILYRGAEMLVIESENFNRWLTGAINHDKITPSPVPLTASFASVGEEVDSVLREKIGVDRAYLESINKIDSSKHLMPPAYVTKENKLIASANSSANSSNNVRVQTASFLDSLGDVAFGVLRDPVALSTAGLIFSGVVSVGGILSSFRRRTKTPEGKEESNDDYFISQWKDIVRLQNGENGEKPVKRRNSNMLSNLSIAGSGLLQVVTYLLNPSPSQVGSYNPTNNTPALVEKVGKSEQREHYESFSRIESNIGFDNQFGLGIIDSNAQYRPIQYTTEHGSYLTNNEGNIVIKKTRDKLGRETYRDAKGRFVSNKLYSALMG